MTKSQNTKNEHLTEQWKKGELPEGHYYIKTHNETNIDEYIQWYKDHGIPSEKSFAYFNVQEVLAPVPSYEEYKDLKSKLQLKETAYDFDTARLEEENAQLKELLKECREEIASVEWDSVVNDRNQMKLLTKIDEALK